MGKTLQGSRTAENLMRAFAGESQARNRYTFYASIAKKEGYVQISNVFTKTADNEKEHAEIFFKHLSKDLNKQNVNITEAGYPVDLGNTLENLKAAAHGENEEHTSIYPAFEQVAREEGFFEIATSFKLISEIEGHHEQRFNTLANNIMNNTVFRKNTEVTWICSNCGHVHSGMEAPQICPVCQHDKGYFELFVEQF